MWAVIVVVDDPTGERRSGVVEVAEQRLVEELVPHAAVERFADAVLHGTTRRDVVPLDADLLRRSRMGFEVNSVPLSLTMSFGLPCLATSIDSSRATRLPEIDVSGIAARHCLVTSSIPLSTRNGCPDAIWS